jgi:copper chaperone CopZ
MTRKTKKVSWELIGAISAAIAASVCCVVPLILLTLGISGAWVSNLAAFEPYRPIFISISLSLLGLAFYRVYSKSIKSIDNECTTGNICATPQANKITKIIFTLSTVLILGLVTFPYATTYIYANETLQQEIPTERVILKIENMTCSTCAITVKKSLMALAGIESVIVTANPPEAIVVFEPTKASINDLIEATTNAGYPSSVIEE